MDQKTTRDLEQILKSKRKTEQLEEYLETLPEEQPHASFRDYYQSLAKVKAMSAADIVAKSGIERTYYYQLMNGTRNPGRDKIITLCIAAGLTVKETQRALEIAQEGILYAKARRDAILIFGMETRLSMTDTNELLEQFGEALLL